MNPLLDFSGLPRFAEFKAEAVTPAIDQLLAECRTLVGLLSNQDTEPDWEGFVEPLDDANERLRRAWGQVSHMN
ncbi:MAG TPA: oligopeptidase A, partial [Burkholderiales bacterium]|nr:oligopeptidase A [Burkholderiales bacterium]